METSVLRFLWRYARKLKWLYVLLLLNILFGQVLSRSTNWASAQIVEVISKGAPDMPTLHVIGRYLLLIFVCLSVAANRGYARQSPFGYALFALLSGQDV